MKKVLAFVLSILIFKTSFTQSNYRLENAQERLATFIVKNIEKNNIDSIYKYFDPGYLKNQKSRINDLLIKFYQEFKTLTPETKRYVTLVWPTGYNLFRFRYIDSTGTALQIDLSFKDDNINSKVLLLETIDKLTLKKQREQTIRFPLPTLKDEQKQTYPYTTTLQLRNCNKELRTMTFNSQTSFFKWWVYGKTDLASNKVAYFSKDYNIDSNYLKENINSVRKLLPKNFWTFPMNDHWYDNEPNENAIWFTQIFAQLDKAGNIKIYAAYKITFEGDDASVDRQRMNPKIKNIEFILNKEDIQALEKKLKASPKGG
ncbi:MAG: hypothetical protein QM726_08835 [Chitinophagaceae bacterium]